MAKKLKHRARDPYTLVIDNRGCVTCKAERTWMIRGPDGVCGSTSWADREHAAELAQDLSRAYEQGFKAGRGK